MVRKKVKKTGCVTASQCITKSWCPWRGLNTRPLPYQGSALPLSYMGAKLRLCCHASVGKRVAGAGEGNRTLVVSLEGFCSTIELHPPCTSEKLPATPQSRESANTPTHNDEQTKKPGTYRCKKTWWRGKDSNLRRLSQQIYSLPPLTAREPLRTKPTIIVGSGVDVNESAWKMLCPTNARPIHQTRAKIPPEPPLPATGRPGQIKSSGVGLNTDRKSGKDRLTPPVAASLLLGESLDLIAAGNYHKLGVSAHKQSRGGSTTSLNLLNKTISY